MSEPKMPPPKMPLPLSEIETSILKAELKRREEAEREAERQRRATQGELYVKNIDALLSVVPEHVMVNYGMVLRVHDRSNCSDANPVNNGCCVRCTLLEAKQDAWWSPNFRLAIHVQAIIHPDN